ncbi:MAG: hypothetical protein LW834_08020 [Cyanobium sp. 49614_E6]|jgi:hypothetical protein|nr:hypothetical protein [Cyanobium sp. 49614_E6]MCE2836895.1 hypothetical protein [Cyanobium sp. 49614_E6]
MDQIDAWAQELKTLHSAEAIKRFRQRFDKATAQRIIRSAVLSEADRAAISLTIQFSGASRYGYADSAYFTEQDIEDLSLPSGQPSS